MKFDAPHFRNEEAARAYVEALRWPDGRVCGKCGSLRSYETKKAGRYRCAEPECRKDFTVMTGTVMEASHVKLTVWLMAFYLMAASKKGVSAHQLHRTLDVTYKTAWFLAHRIREAMKAGGLAGPLGGSGQVVEADETYFGPVDEHRRVRSRGGVYRYKKGRGPTLLFASVCIFSSIFFGRKDHPRTRDLSGRPHCRGKLRCAGVLAQRRVSADRNDRQLRRGHVFG